MGSLFLSDYLTDLVLAPAIVLWALAGLSGLQSGSRRRTIEATLVYGGLLLIWIVVFGSRIQGQEVAPAPVLIYLPVPLLLWAATRFGLRGVLTALSLICLLGVTGVARGWGHSSHCPPATMCSRCKYSSSSSGYRSSFWGRW